MPLPRAAAGAARLVAGVARIATASSSPQPAVPRPRHAERESCRQTRKPPLASPSPSCRTRYPPRQSGSIEAAARRSCHAGFLRARARPVKLETKPDGEADSLQELLPIADLAPPAEPLPPKTRRLYCNRDLRLDQIEAIGFDLDYTLAIYKQAEMDRLSIEATAQKLVALGYPESLLHMSYLAHFPIRGLLVDTKLGNVLKTDRYRYAKKAYHGSRALEQRGAQAPVPGQAHPARARTTTRSTRCTR